MKHLLKALLVVAFIGGLAAVFHPDTPLPDEWNPRTPLDINAPLTELTGWKLRRALAEDRACLEALDRGGVSYAPQAAFEESEVCHIDPRVTLHAVGQATLRPVETRCQSALRLAMWERHGLQTAAERHLGVAIREIRHFSSYSCRKLRSTNGVSSRMSSHATANAIDVSGFVTTDGQIVDLKQHWTQPGPKSAFLKDVFDASCLWFPVALGPEFNALHADHFHLQTTGWGLCR